MEPRSWHQRSQYKLYKKSSGTRIRSKIFSERVITVWNELSVSTDFSTITRFKNSILNADFYDHLCIHVVSYTLPQISKNY